jgi:hypothetical protein
MGDRKGVALVARGFYIARVAFPRTRGTLDLGPSACGETLAIYNPLAQALGKSLLFEVVEGVCGGLRKVEEI